MTYLSYEDTDWMISSLAAQIKESGKTFRGIIGIAFGGLNISVPLSKILKLPHSQVRISRYDGQQKREQPIVEGEVKGMDT